MCRGRGGGGGERELICKGCGVDAMEFNSCRRRCTTNHKMCEQDPWAGPDVEDLEGGRRKGSAVVQVRDGMQFPDGQGLVDKLIQRYGAAARARALSLSAHRPISTQASPPDQMRKVWV